MNVLVTGCKGQLGNELYKIITEKKSELGEIPQCFHDCKLTCIDVEDLDITDLEAVQAYTRTLRPEVVINCAAYTNVNGCEATGTRRSGSTPWAPEILLWPARKPAPSWCTCLPTTCFRETAQSLTWSGTCAAPSLFTAEPSIWENSMSVISAPGILSSEPRGFTAMWAITL